MKKKHIIIVIGFLIMNHLYSQVEGPERIIGTFTGSMKKNLANGEGKSVGSDTYEGNFKKGYPHGKGTYTFGEDVEIEGYLFKAGDIYQGEFNKGMFEGYGKLTCNDDQKTVVEGYWSKNNYIGRTRDGYEIILKKNIERVECRYDGNFKNDIVITGIDHIVEAGGSNREFDGQSKYTDLPVEKFPMTLHIKGTITSTGSKVELKVLLEKPGIWTIIITGDSIDSSLRMFVSIDNF